uniref:Fumarate reductase (SdhA) n=1 Tax=uncultured marine group II/III euryarchaeote KM3_192_C12 TaxID=1457964 RepID=A0A075GU55_9EURY|nr:fumarate reductase (sdhA) [uncultured marine group II/III euryarchaeote KM3_192_C12]
MDAWDVIVVGGGVAALRAAIAAHDGGATVTILESGATGSGGAGMACEGFSVSANETNSNNHADDIIRAGAGECDESVVRIRTASAFGHLAELERWGLVLRRDEQGLPLLLSAPGHSEPRLATTGDSTGREIHTILEEQCIKRAISRRGDIQPLTLALDGDSISGMVCLDVQRGELVAMQAKSIVLATDGFQAAWNGDGVGSGDGAWLALDAGVALRGSEMVAWNPLTMDSHGLSLPLSILNDGAAVRLASGGDVAFASDSGLHAASVAITSGEPCVLDARALDRGTEVWYSDTAERVNSRLGAPMDEAVIPLAPRVSTTLGGVPCDGSGSVSSVSGLHAAGDCANSGYHGADLTGGDRLLEAVDGGSCAGLSAAEHASSATFADGDSVDEALSTSATLVAALLHGNGGDITRGAASQQLADIMSDSMGMSRSSDALAAAATQLESLSAAEMSLSDSNPIMNTELVEVVRLQGLIRLASASVNAAAERDNSCGSHQRSDE